MKSTEFLKEDDWEDSEREYNEMEAKVGAIAKKFGLSPEQVNFAWEVKEDCQSYINQNPAAITTSPLFRGIHSSQDTLKKKVRLDNRQPLDSSNSVHAELNRVFQDQFGEPFRNALFVTNDKYQANNYGEIYIIFPRGNFTFLWSPDMEDIFNAYENKLHTESDEDFVYALLRNNNYYTNSLPKAIHSGNEIMMRCGSYYAIRQSSLDVNTQMGIQAIINL